QQVAAAPQVVAPAEPPKPVDVQPAAPAPASAAAPASVPAPAPAPAPAAESKPAEPPKAADAPESKPAEAKAPEAKPKPAPAPAQGGSMLDDLLSSPITLISIIAAIGLGGVLALLATRRKRATRGFEDSIMTGTDIKTNTVFGNTGGG